MTVLLVTDTQTWYEIIRVTALKKEKEKKVAKAKISGAQTHTHTHASTLLTLNELAGYDKDQREGDQEANT